ncbi:MAG: hypothetical protein IKE36_05330 [Solobacterium sp.]|nr:hypothetical protein [Solobacterium sp.]
MFKKFCSLLISLSLILIATGQTVMALSSDQSDKTDDFDALLEMSASEQYEFLISHGLVLSASMQNEELSFKEEMVSWAIQDIHDKGVLVNRLYGDRNIYELQLSVVKTLSSLGYIPDEKTQSLRYTLQDSTILNTWNNNYMNYNCYAYALGYTYWMQPGEYAGYTYSSSLSASDVADYVISDLNARNCWAYKQQAKPFSLPDSYCKVIVIRKMSAPPYDFHFMKGTSSNLNYWSHKPGISQPLKWNYSSPGYKVWTNEGATYNNPIAPTYTYNSTTYYIIYKSYSDPGIQYSDLVSS